MTELRRETLIFQWGISSFYGWGVYGLNLMRHLADDPFFAPISACPFRREDLLLDQADWRRVGPLLDQTERFHAQLAPHHGRDLTIAHPLLLGLGNNLAPGSGTAHRVRLRSDRAVGVVFLERSDFDATLRERARAFRRIIAGSRWGEAMLRARGIDNVVTVLQGIDGGVFHPAPTPRTRFPGFAVFSGGKIEPRKAQDLVLLAFRAFQRRHPDAVLVTAWHSPWEETSPDRMFGDRVAPPPRRDGRIDVVGWAVANGIPATAVVDLGAVPNREMAAILRQTDVALFPNRCEGGTNLVAMEAMACGVPAILADNTGQRDLISPGACLPLTRQRALPHPALEGWGESDVEEMVEALERLYQDRALAARIGAAGAALMAGFDWGARIAHLRAELLDALVF